MPSFRQATMPLAAAFSRELCQDRGMEQSGFRVGYGVSGHTSKLRLNIKSYLVITKGRREIPFMLGTIQQRQLYFVSIQI